MTPLQTHDRFCANTPNRRSIICNEKELLLRGVGSRDLLTRIVKSDVITKKEA